VDIHRERFARRTAQLHREMPRPPMPNPLISPGCSRALRKAERRRRRAHQDGAMFRGFRPATEDAVRRNADKFGETSVTMFPDRLPTRKTVRPSGNAGNAA
jgi:alpha-ketoglutarate-dependent taurine dioxygenase